MHDYWIQLLFQLMRHSAEVFSIIAKVFHISQPVDKILADDADFVRNANEFMLFSL